LRDPLRRSWLFEQRQGHLHFIAKRPYLAPFVLLLTSFGVGLTVMGWPWAKGHSLNARREAKSAEFLLRWAPLVTTLEVRHSWIHFDFRVVRKRSRLRGLYFFSGVFAFTDFSRLSSLELLASNSSSIRKIVGLGALPNLREIHCVNPGITWLRALPTSIEVLFHSGKFPSNLDLSRFSDLKRLGLDSLKTLDISTLPSAPSVVELDLSRVGKLDNLSSLEEKFPNLKTLNIGEVLRSDYDQAVEVLKGL